MASAGARAYSLMGALGSRDKAPSEVRD